jgi:hypothetical protein
VRAWVRRALRAVDSLNRCDHRTADQAVPQHSGPPVGRVQSEPSGKRGEPRQGADGQSSGVGILNDARGGAVPT